MCGIACIHLEKLTCLATRDKVRKLMEGAEEKRVAQGVGGLKMLFPGIGVNGSLIHCTVGHPHHKGMGGEDVVAMRNCFIHLGLV